MAYAMLTSTVLLSIPANSLAAPAGTLTFVEPEKDATFAFVDNAPRTRLKHGEPKLISAGDNLVFSNPAEQSGKKVGYQQIWCVATKTSKSFAGADFSCLGTYVLSGGTLESSTVLTSHGAEGAITGGTGTYAGARGTLSAVDGKGAATTTVTLTG